MKIFGKKIPFLDVFKDDVSKYLRKADELVRSKNYDEALKEIEKAFELDPKNVYIRSFIERVRYLVQKEKEKKSRIFGEPDSTLERRMETISQLLISAEQHIKAKNYTMALDAISKVYQIDPKNHYAQIFSERIEELMRAEPAQKREEIPPIQTEEKYVPSAISSDSRVNSLDEDDRLKSITEAESGMQEATTPAGRFALYRELLKECWADGAITPEESDMLHRLRTQYNISFEDHCRMEIDIKIDAYVDALQIVWQDGIVTEDEQEILEIMREKYKITPEEQATAERRFTLLRATNQPQWSLIIVDSNQDELISVARALISHGYAVKVTKHPNEALQYMQNNIPDLILSEVFFPPFDTDGFAFFQMVRSNEKWSHIPFIMMTYPGDGRIVRAGLRMGVDYFIPKPLHMDFMIAVVEGKLKAGKWLTKR